MNEKEYDKKIGEVAEMIIANFEPILLNNSFYGLKHLVDHYCKDYDVDTSRFTCKEIMYQILKTYEIRRDTSDIRFINVVSKRKDEEFCINTYEQTGILYNALSNKRLL